ncbi:MAG: murein biosynthesis integral membrane protein MurJ [Acidimicrobiia bacterium]|nr:murein biosynthesis integral membrane protein MurJ [Acidimicrobiia bacterium]MYC58123.1 murein biosynthesis integral membrane protein MurJ [Acidimicrobiia bacterium]MYI30555.1 murein biosynthesis integral membrane protein MurJ [Acidimicrobiia bacterium]
MTFAVIQVAYLAIAANNQQLNSPRESTRSDGKGAFFVGAGIILSRIAGIGREISVAAFIGAGHVGDAYRAALAIPRLLQNLLGEGALSASFIPVYSQLLEKNQRAAAGRLAGAVLGLLSMITGLLVLAGWLLAEPLVSLLLWRLSSQTTDLTVELVRVMFAGMGFIVLATWALGILNAHRRFFLSYAAPVIWNITQVMFMVGGWIAWHHVNPANRASDIAKLAAWGVVLGGALQFLIQLPLVLRLVSRLRLSMNWRQPDVRVVLNRFGPALAGRGVVQLSAYVDLILAGLLAGGAIAALGFAQVIYFLPISLFAISVAASDLPEMSRKQGDPNAIIIRLKTGLERVSFYVLFSTVAFIAMGGLIVGALLQRGQFSADQTIQVWWILAAYSLGLLPTAWSRLLQNACFAAGDTSGPARVAGVRVVLAAALGVVLMFSLDSYGVIDTSVQLLGDFKVLTPLSDAARTTEVVRLGAVGLALGTTAAAWIEYYILRHRVGFMLRQANTTQTTANNTNPLRRLADGLWLASGIAGVLGAVLAWGLQPLPVLFTAPLTLMFTALLYVFVAQSAGVKTAEEIATILDKLLKLPKRTSKAEVTQPKNHDE